MAREIAEAGAALRRQLSANVAALAELAARLRAHPPAFVVTIARGSSDHAALFLKHLLEIKIGLASASLGPSIASLYNAPLRLRGALSISISQSGRSPDIVAAQRAVMEAGAFAITLVNDSESPLAQEAEALLPLHAGEEKSVAATKSMIASLVAGAALVAAWDEDAQLASALNRLPSILEVHSRPAPEVAIAKLARASSLFVLGRGPTFAIAAEAALKLKETSGVHAEAFSSAEVLHGPAAVISGGFPLLCFAPSDAARSRFFETVEKLASFGASPLMVDTEPHSRWPTILSPDAGHSLVTPIAALHAFYGLAETAARRRGRNPDRPPHLAKVTKTM